MLDNYADVLGIRMLNGRWFDERDGAESQPVVVIDQYFAQEAFGNSDPIGQQLQIGAGEGSEADWRTVVGVINPIMLDEIDDPCGAARSFRWHRHRCGSLPSPRLVRVMGHELNNSLTPIKSMATTLRTRLAQGVAVDTLRDDLGSSLDVIASRSEALGRFMAGYTMLARLPSPQRRNVRLRALVERAAIDTRLEVQLEGEEIGIGVDPDQLEQLLINLVKNAIDAAGETGEVKVRWRTTSETLCLEILDNGPGLSGTDNLFVPLFTTKPGGTGIGLVLCRQIAEAHDGALALENRDDARGCVARLELPLRSV